MQIPRNGRVLVGPRPGRGGSTSPDSAQRVERGPGRARRRAGSSRSQPSRSAAVVDEPVREPERLERVPDTGRVARPVVDDPDHDAQQSTERPPPAEPAFRARLRPRRKPQDHGRVGRCRDRPAHASASATASATSSSFDGRPLAGLVLEADLEVAAGFERGAGHGCAQDVAAEHRYRPRQPGALEHLEVRVECLDGRRQTERDAGAAVKYPPGPPK